MGKNQGGPENPVSDLNTTLPAPGTHGGLLKEPFTTTPTPPSHLPPTNPALPSGRRRCLCLHSPYAFLKPQFSCL